MDPDYIRFYGQFTESGNDLCQAKTYEFQEPLDLSAYAGIALEVRSQEALNYKFGLRDRSGKDLIVWEAKFGVPKSPPFQGNAFINASWKHIEIPFKNFRPIRTGEFLDGRKMKLAKKDLKEVYSFEITLSKFD